MHLVGVGGCVIIGTACVSRQVCEFGVVGNRTFVSTHECVLDNRVGH